MQHTHLEIASFPRHLLGEEEAALHGLAGGLDTVIEVYDATANEIVTYGTATSPTRARWIVRYPNGTYGASLIKGVDDQLPGPGSPLPVSRTGWTMHKGQVIILATWRAPI